MTRRIPTASHLPSQSGTKPCALELPMQWAPAQAAAVFEVLDDLRDLIWCRFGRQIQQVLREDRATATSAIPGNLNDGDLPF